MKTILALTLAAVVAGGCSPGMMIKEHRRQTYVAQHVDLPATTRTCILEGKILLGMSKADVVASWGQPHHINRSAGAWGASEQWVYGTNGRYGFTPSGFLYFEEGTLTDWQVSAK